MAWEKKILFTATADDPDHTHIFDNPVFNETMSFHGGFSVMGLTKIEINTLTNDKDLIIRAYIGDKFVAKDFVFGFMEKNCKVEFFQAYLNGKPLDYFGFNLIEKEG